MPLPTGAVMPWRNISCRHRGSVAILDLARKSCRYGEVEIHHAVAALWQQGERRFLLNMAEVPLIDSGCLGDIVRTFTDVHRQGGRCALCAVHPRMRSLLDIITRLSGHIPVFPVFETEDAGVESLEAETWDTARAAPPKGILPDLGRTGMKAGRDLFTSWSRDSGEPQLIDKIGFWAAVAFGVLLLGALAADLR